MLLDIGVSCIGGLFTVGLLFLVLSFESVKARTIGVIALLLLKLARDGSWIGILINFRLTGGFATPNLETLKMVVWNFGMLVQSALPAFDRLMVGIFFFAELLLFVAGVKLIRTARISWRQSFSLMIFAGAISVSFVAGDAWRRNRFQGNPFQLAYHSITHPWLGSQWLTFRALPFPWNYLNGIVTTHQNNACLNMAGKLGRNPKFSKDIHIIAEPETSEPPVSAVLIGIQLESINLPLALSNLVDGSATMPYLKDLLTRSGYLKGPSPLFTSIQEGSTSDAEFAVLCGLEPSIKERSFFRITALRRECLPKVLRHKGFYTISSHANYLHIWNRSVAYPVLGFDQMFSLGDMNTADSNNNDYVKVSDHDSLAFTIAQLSSPSLKNKNIFVHFLGIETHSPYQNSMEALPVLRKEALECPSCDESLLATLARRSNHVDDGLHQGIRKIRDASLADGRVYVVYIYGDHAPPVRRNAFEDATALHKSIAALTSHDQALPYAALVIRGGHTQVLKFDASKNNGFSQPDVIGVLAEQLGSQGLLELQPLRHSLERFSVERRGFEHPYRLSQGQLISKNNILELNAGDTYWDEIMRTEKAFGCSLPIADMDSPEEAATINGI